MKKKKTISRLKKDLDKYFSLYIRHRDQGVCFTCGVKRDIKEMQNGHFFSRSYMSLRYNEKNCNTQCMPCNVFKNGNMAIYSIRLVQKYGNEVLSELEKEARSIRKFTRADYEELILFYKTQLPVL